MCNAKHNQNRSRRKGSDQGVSIWTNDGLKFKLKKYVETAEINLWVSVFTGEPDSYRYETLLPVEGKERYGIFFY
jgi:hypothetical protein